VLSETLCIWSEENSFCRRCHFDLKVAEFFRNKILVKQLGLMFVDAVLLSILSLISSSTQSQYLKTTIISDLILNKLRPTSLSTDWIENEHFGLVLAKRVIFTPKLDLCIKSGTESGGILPK
jgi:hypothetical protein